jgi:Putative amidase domain
MVSFAELRDAQPQSWTTAADDTLSAAKQCERIKDDIHDNGVKPLDSAWSSWAAGQARSTLTTVANQAEVTSILARAAVDPLDTLDHAIQTAQTELGEGVHLATSHGLFVDQSTGAVSLPIGPYSASALDRMESARNQAQELINNAIKSANEADALCTQALNAAAKPDITNTSVDQAEQIQADNTKKALQELTDTIPAGLSPQENAAWWNGLTPEEQFDLERACPVQIYNLPGIPDSVKKDIDRPGLGYSSVGTVAYALDNWNNSNLDWTKKDNCTNFASDALAYGGNMPFKEDWGGLIPRHWDTKGWSDGSNADGGDPLPGLSHTPTWGAAQNNHDFFLNNGGTVVSPGQARPGDVMYYTMTQNDPAAHLHAGDTHHTVIVTGVLPDNQVMYTQHSGDAQNYPLYGRLPEFQQGLGKQNTQIVQPKVTW